MVARHIGPARTHDGERGFSLVELVIAMAVLMVVAMAGLTLVDAGQRAATTQTGVAELQNNQRVAQQELARMLAMTGVGGLPEGIDPSLGGTETAGVFPRAISHRGGRIVWAGLKQRPRKIGGRCGECTYFDVCGGNTRVRAFQLTNDPWAEDPACYLHDEEIGVAGSGGRLEVTPFKGTRHASAAE